MRSASAETRADHPDPALRPRAYEGSYEEVFGRVASALAELDAVQLAEADPRRGALEAWVRLLPLASLPGGGDRKDPHAHGRGWFARLDPRVAHGWLQVRVAAADKGKVEVHGRLTLELPLAGPLAAFLLRRTLSWVDLRFGLPRRP